MADLLKVERLTKTYGTGATPFTALSDIDLSIGEGEFVCLLGPSGCGKSTLLRIIAGLSVPTTGEVLYRDQPVRGINPHATIVFQTFGLFPWLTVQDNVEVALKALGMDRDQRRGRADELLHVVGLDGFESAYPRELSGGMRQKVGFARAMAVEPELLCLDEPFSALDVLSAEALRGELLELWQSRAIPTKAILMVTHNIEEAVLLADRIIVMAKEPGRIIGDIRIALRHPRQRKALAFQSMVDRVYSAVTARERRTPAGGEGPARMLPAARVEAVAGLLEKALSDGGRSDLFRLAAELGIDLHDVLPIVEAAELLGFAQMVQGDLVLTALGRDYAEASITVRKELLAGRMLRVPLVRWVYQTLQQDSDKRMEQDYCLEALREQFGAAAEKQLDIIIQWGRFAELFGYDSHRKELFFAPES